MKKKNANFDKPPNKNGIIDFLVKFTPYLIGVPILCVVNYMCYEANNRLLKPATNLMWLGIMTIFWFKYYKLTNKK